MHPTTTEPTSKRRTRLYRSCRHDPGTDKFRARVNKHAGDTNWSCKLCEADPAKPRVACAPLTPRPDAERHASPVRRECIWNQQAAGCHPPRPESRAPGPRGSSTAAGGGASSSFRSKVLTGERGAEAADWKVR